MKSDFKYDLSIALITKNEIKYIEKCLKALLPLKDIISCEIIVTDTGSTDGTIEVIEKYADKVLHFEWCNDFSKARNTGVDASCGRWFMFVDADEIFDETVTEIGEFIKSQNSNEYDALTHIIKNYTHEDSDNGNEFNSIRLCNNSNGKVYFKGKIHEQLELKNFNIYDLKAKSHHYGYLNTIIKQKKDRNLPLIENAHKENPSDLRIISQLMDCHDDLNKKVSIALDGISIAKKTNQSESLTINIIYVKLFSVYFGMRNYSKILSDFKNVINKMKVHTLSKLEILYYVSSAYLEIGNLDEASKYFFEYQEEYKYLTKNKDEVYSMLFLSTAINQSKYIDLSLKLSKQLKIRVGVLEAGNILRKNNIYEYNYQGDGFKNIFDYVNLVSDFDDGYFLKDLPKFFTELEDDKDKIIFMKKVNSLFINLYGEAKTNFLNCFRNELVSKNHFLAFNNLRANEYNAKLCSSDVIEAITESSDTYELDLFSDILYATIKFEEDTFNLFEKCTLDYLKMLASKVEQEHDDFVGLVYEKLSSKLFEKNMKTIEFKCYLLNLCITLSLNKSKFYQYGVGYSNVDVTAEIFDNLIIASSNYVNLVFDTSISKDELIKILPDYQAFCFSIYDEFKEKEKFQKKYLKAIIENVELCPRLCKAVLNSISEKYNGIADIEILELENAIDLRRHSI